MSTNIGRNGHKVNTQTILSALEDVQQHGENQWMAKCPCHNDEKPSLSLALKDGRLLVKCFAGCDQKTVFNRILELAGFKRYKVERKSNNNGNGHHEATETPEELNTTTTSAEPTPAPSEEQTGLTLEQLAQAKALPVGFLKTLGLAEFNRKKEPAFVSIPYYDQDGNEVTRRYRYALNGSNRFKWARGSKTMLYGLDRLNAAREAAGFVVIVEGESDCWTLWFCGIHAVGVPGKSTWKPEWTQHLEGLRVFIWEEPNAEDFTLRIGKDLPNALVIRAAEYKDPSEVFVALGKERFVQWFQERMQQAEPVQDIIKRQNDAELARLHEEVKHILEHPDPLELVKRELQKLYAGDYTPALLAYLSATTRLLPQRHGEMPAHLMLLGSPSCGKSHAVDSVKMLLPSSAYYSVDAGSPRSLIYNEESFEHRAIFVSEADSIPRGEDSPAASALRALLQDGQLKYDVTVERDGDTPVTKTIIKQGPTTLITTSTKRLGEQLDSRLFILPVRDDAEQVSIVVDAICEAQETDNAPIVDDKLVAYQEYLQRQAPITVRVPFAGALGRCLKRSMMGTRVLRDLERLFSLIKAVAIIRNRREATIDDYREVWGISDGMYAATSTGVTERIRQVVTAVYQLRAELGDNETVNLCSIEQHLGTLNRMQIKRAVDQALRGRWLENRNKNNGYDLVVGEPLPDETALPTPEEVEREWRGDTPPDGSGGTTDSKTEVETDNNTPCNSHVTSCNTFVTGCNACNVVPGSNTHTHSCDNGAAGDEESECVCTLPENCVTCVTTRYNDVTETVSAAASSSPIDVISDFSDIEEDPFAEDEQSVLECAPWRVNYVNYQLITSDDGLREFVSSCHEWVALDVETTALHPAEGRIRVVSLSADHGTAVVDADRVDLKLLQTLFEKCRVIGHNLTFDLTFLMAAGVHIPASVRLADTMLAAQVLEASNAEQKRGHFTLEACLKRYLHIDLDKTLQKSDWSGELTEEQLEYAANDVMVLSLLWDVLHEQLKNDNLLKAAHIEMQALPAVVWMTLNGVPFDEAEWKRQSEADEQELQRVREELDSLVEQETGFLCGVNWNSHKQVIELLNGLGVPVTSVAEDQLKPHAEHPVVAKLLEYKQIQKRVGTFGSEFLKKARLKDGRLYPNWRQMGASTGRMSCSDPNLQQIPRSDRRKCFTAPEGRTLVIADYSQIELRIAAEIANDARMLEAFQNGVDLHTLTAQLVMGKQDVTKADRTAAKALNFGLLYGMGWRGLKQYAHTTYNVSLTDEQAQEFRDRFFETYSGLASWHRETRAAVEAADVCEAYTLSGRRRVLYPKQRKDGEEYPPYTDALNHPVQGTGADGLKEALALIWQEHEQYPSVRLVACVHDEVVLECDAAEAEDVAEWLKSCMVRGMQRFLKLVPVEVEVTLSKTWTK